MNWGTSRLLVLVGAASLLAAPSKSPKAPQIQAAVAKAVQLIQQSQTQWIKTQTCASCHHSMVPALTLMTAREHGVTIDEEAASRHFARTFAESVDADASFQGAWSIDPAMFDSYQMVAANALGLKGSLAAAARARFLATRQTAEGNWKTLDFRPPQSGSSFTITALSLRSLQLYMPEQLAQETAERVARARTWLERETPRSTEDRAFQLLGMQWAGSSPEIRSRAAKALLAEQRADGGWSQLPTRGSDAYATGEVLTALHQGGEIQLNHPAYQRGVRYLIRSQKADGSWLVESRQHDDVPINPPYFESGFPYGKNQFASTSGTSWAALALSLALPKTSVKPLVIAGLEPAEQPSWASTALFGTAAQLQALVNKGLEVNSRTKGGTSVLMMASADPEKVKLLLDRGANVNAKAKSGYTALMVTSSYGNTVEVARQLLARGAMVNFKGKDKTPFNASPLLHAAISGEAAKVALLLARGADPNQKTIVFNIFPASPLMLAVAYGHEAVIRDLVRAGADIHVLDGEGLNLVEAAAISGDANTVKLLADLGARVNHVDKRGMTALLWASTMELDNAKVIETLLKAGADPEIKGRSGITAVSQAHKYGNREALTLLKRARQ